MVRIKLGRKKGVLGLKEHLSKALREVIVRALVALQAETRAKAQAGGRGVSFVEERPGRVE